MTEHIDPRERATEPGPTADDLERVTAETRNWLHARGVDVSPADRPEDLAALRDEVEAFEREVHDQGGDLMVAEPAQGHTVESGGGQAVAPGQSPFVLPGRREGEPVADYLARLRVATESVRLYRR